ncbi:ABC transporter substrate-binding protein [Paenibacillus methanolicus]|uniref:MarR-like DNA-binding transcriptional regulator SgrR of sgrS sRNA n=1 Tax=Paenibacillus methanolicus TaxID=582686 RepID=A0A5S5BZL3_9BACL|nr:ABC transporter substrate-binding protein [Paenibacillus methanolicus]TYP72494.1 MarR-like DNA-binding transcriptional regulator SgrR of sgrS sRNA [Paenibacillus methanolicus]
METEEYYFMLRRRFADAPVRLPLDISMDTLTELFGCTRRNAQFILRRLMDGGFIEWRAGRGRGHRSSLVLLIDHGELALERAAKLVTNGRLSEARGLIDGFSDSGLSYAFSQWLAGQLGISRDPEEQDVLRFPFYRTVPALDPPLVMRRTEAHWVEQIFNTIVGFRVSDRSVQPKLAHYWEEEDGGRCWTFFLRKGVRFHNGKLMAARDAVYAIERVFRLNPAHWLAGFILHIQACGTYGIRIELSEPVSCLPEALCMEHFAIVPEEADRLTGTSDFARMPIGTGPFRVVRNDESMLALEANDHYFEGRPHIDRIEMWVWPDYEGIETSEVTRHDAQLLYFEALEKNGHPPSLSQVEEGSVYLVFNQAKDGIARNERFRRGIRLGLDRGRMVEELGGLRYSVSEGFLLPDCLPIRESGEEADLSLAAETIKQSGYGGETVRIYTYAMASNEQNAAWIQRACGVIGVQAEVIVLPIERLAEPDVMLGADLIVAGEVMGEQPDLTLIGVYTSARSFVRPLLAEADRKAVDAQIADCLKQRDYESRIKALASIEERLKRTCSLLFLYHSIQTADYDASLRGIALNAWGKVNYKEVWVRRHAGQAKHGQD